MARMSGVHSTVDIPAELARANADPEKPVPDSVARQNDQIAQNDQAEMDTAELPSFRPLTGPAFWRAARQAPAVDELATQAGPAAGNRKTPWIDRKVAGPTAAASMGDPDNPKVASRSGGYSSGRFRFALFAVLFALGAAAGMGSAYVAEILGTVGGSYMQYARTALSFITAAVRSREAQTNDGTNTGYSVGDTSIGSNAAIDQRVNGAGKSSNPSGLSTRPHDPATPRGPGQLSGADIPTGDASLAVLVQQAERQLAHRQLERPDEDNALATYRRLVAISPDHPGTTFVGERLSTAFWSLAMDAKAAEHWDEALHYLNILDSLPPVPAAAILAGAERSPASAARGGTRQTMDAPGPAKIDSVAQSKAAPVQGAAREIDHLPDGPQATATESPSTKDVSQAIASLAITRGDGAMRLGDVAAARRFYQLAASAGIAGAATAVARTYDPIFLQKAGVRGLQGNVETAMRWYQKAVDEGDTEARTRMKQLLDTAEGSRR